MRTATTVSLMLLLACLECQSTSPTVAALAPRRTTIAPTGVNQTDRTVLAAVLNRELAGDKGTIVLEDRTTPASPDRQNTIAFGLKKGWMKPIRKGEPARKPLQGTVSEWLRRNNKPVSLPALSADRKVIMLTEKESERIFRHGGWPAFYKRFPNSNGLTRVSLPGYSKDGSEAVVLLGNQRQIRWGHGTLYYLTKEKGMWRVRGTMGLWQS